MKIRDPQRLRQMYAEKHQWYTLDEICFGLKMSKHTVCNAFNGRTIRPTTVKRFAEKLQVSATDIATFIG
jgi:hypothetical protein